MTREREPAASPRPKRPWPAWALTLGGQWHLCNTGQGGGRPGADVDAPGAWAITTGSPDVAVVVLDVGVDIGHPALAAGLLPGWNFDSDTDDPTNPSSSHGTAAAGIIAARPCAAMPVVGVAPGCRIVPVRVGALHPWERWGEVIEWATSRGRVLSFSLSLPPNALVEEAIRRAVASGVVVCCAAGNRGNVVHGVSFPACLPDTIGVGASTNLDQRAGYSQHGEGLDVVAPSSGGTLGIETTATRGRGAPSCPGGPPGDTCRATDWTAACGTSAATALVAGVAALMLSVNPALRPCEVRAILRETANTIDPGDAPYDASGFSPRVGCGRVNAARAVARAREVR